MSDERPCIYIDSATSSGDEVRLYYELPDDLVRSVWEAAFGPPVENETLAFDQALAHLLSEFASYVEATVAFKREIAGLAGRLDALGGGES